MKHLIVAGFLAYSALMQATDAEALGGSSAENEFLKNENEALKAEVASLRAQLKQKEQVDPYQQESVVAHTSQKTSTDNMPNDLTPTSQTAGLDYKVTDDLRVSVGTKLWINKWEKFIPDAENNAVHVSQSDTALTPIPTASLKYKNFFVAGSYFSDTNYQWVANIILPAGNSLAPDGSVTTNYIDGSRREYDVTVGYFVHPNLAVTAGYKDILQSFNTVGTLNGVVGYRNQVEFKYQGALLGLIGSVPIGNGFGFYGNFAYGWMNGDFGGFAGINNRDANYVLVDGGISYSYSLRNLAAFPMSVSAFAGYRYQSIEVEHLGGTNSNANDYTKGFVTGLNLTF